MLPIEIMTSRNMICQKHAKGSSITVLENQSIIVPIKNNRTIFITLVLASIIAVFCPACSNKRSESPTTRNYSEGTLIPYIPTGGTDVVQTTCQGDTTHLHIRQVRARWPRHDVDMGRTTLTLFALDSKQELLQVTFKELWECLGYNRATKRYVLISKNEHGVKVTLRGLVYLQERPSTFRESVFGQQGFAATASLLNPEGTYLVLIGAPREQEQYQLYVLNLVTDQLELLGDPPAPPPLTPEELEWPEAEIMMDTWESPERHYTDLDPGIWMFTSPHTLQVSFGNDTLKARSKQRTIKTWNLQQKFAH